jgi:hypothetical protein
MNVNPQIGGAIRPGTFLNEVGVDKISEAAHKVGLHTAATFQEASDMRKKSTAFVVDKLTKTSGLIMAATPNLITPATKLLEPATKYNTFYKIIVLFLFFTVFLKVIINIFKFFGIDIIDLFSYMGWFVFLLIILIFIPHDYSTLKLN